MRIFGSILKRRAMTAYKRRLPRLLVKDYGLAEAYTPAQIESAIRRHQLNAKYAAYAIAMFGTKIEFDAFYARIGETRDYDSARGEIASRFFVGYDDFSVADMMTAMARDGSLHDTSGSLEVGSHGSHHGPLP